MNWRCLLFWSVAVKVPLFDAKRDAWTATPGDGIRSPRVTQLGKTQGGMGHDLEHTAGPEPKRTSDRLANEQFIYWLVRADGDEQETRH